MNRALSLLLVLLLAGPALADDPDPGQPVPDAVRKASIRKLGKKLKKRARSRRAPKYRDEILTMLESLQVLGGWEAGKAALEAVPLADAEIRDKAFQLAETHHDPKLVAPLARMLEDKLYRDDEDARCRIARSLSIMADDAAVPPLTELIRTDEIPEVVAAAADSLAVYAGAPLRLRKDAVKRLIDLYTATWNLMMSMRPEDKVIAGTMRKQWKIYNRPVRGALQALTGEQEVSRPQEWRDWWNDHKKRTDW